MSGVLTVGYVVWMVRGGLLLASFMSSMPAWQTIDPLPVLQFGVQGSDDEDDESIASMVNAGADELS